MNNVGQNVAQVSKPAVSPTSKSAGRVKGASPAGLETCDAAEPQPKERGVYAASTLEVPQPVKREEGLESSNAEAA